MSFAHVSFNLNSEDESYSEYIVTSFDFNSELRDEEIGRVQINKKNKTYSFKCTNIWEDENVIPPETFYLSQEKQNELLNDKYQGACYGGWSEQIHYWAIKQINACI